MLVTDASTASLMRKRRNPLVRGLVLGLALTLALPEIVVHAAPAGDFEQLMSEADGHADAGRHADALRTYIAAFDAMPVELQVSEVGEFVALAAAKAAMADYQERQDALSLTRGRVVLAKFIELAGNAEGAASADAASARLAELDAMVPAESEEPDDAEVTPVASPADTEPAPSAEPVDEPSSRRRALGLGLVIGGGAAAAAGLGLTIAGARQVPWYEQQLADRGWTPQTPGYDEEISDAQRIRNIDIGIGVALLLVGVGLSVRGGVLLAKERRGPGPRASVVPSIRRDGVGLVTQLSF